MNRGGLLFIHAVVVCVAIGCSEKCTCPENSLSSVLGKHVWSKRFGDENNQYAAAVAVDASGNVIVAGYFYGTVDFGGGALTSAGQQDIFVAKFRSDGAHLWSKRFGDGYYQEAHAVAIDASGNVIVTGEFKGTVDFGGGALTDAGYGDIFVAKLGPDGTHIWSKRFGDGYNQYATAVAVDAAENVIVVGHFMGYVNFGGGALVGAGADDIYVAKFGSDGTHLWSKRFGDGSDQYATAVAVDASENVIIAGGMSGTVDFGGGELISEGDYDIFVAKFGSDGAHLWSKRFGDGSYQNATAIAMGASGNAIVTGDFEGTVDFGDGELTSAGQHDIFVAKFGSDGARLWSKRFGDVNWQHAYAVAIDASENEIITGEFRGSVDFGGGALTSAGNYEVFVAKFGSDGGHLWSKRFGDGNEARAYAAAVDASGNAIVVGVFAGIVDFGGGVLANAGNNSYDIFVVKLGR